MKKGLKEFVPDSKDSLEDLLKIKFAIESASEQIVITDSEGVVTYANPAIENITGYTVKEAVGNKAGKLWSLPMPDDYYKKMWKTIKDEKKVFISEIKNKRKNGEIYSARISISPIIQNKKLIGFVGVENDISEMKNVEEVMKQKIEEAQKMNNLMVGREIKMVDLKNTIENLKERLRKYEEVIG